MQRFPYHHVSQPIKIGDHEVRNRIVRTAHGTNLMPPDGTLSERFYAYHERRAEGGVGLSISEGQPVNLHSTRAGRGSLPLWDDRVLPELEQLSKRMRKHGMSMFVQLIHMGVNAASPDLEPAWSPSEVADPLSGRVPISMTRAMIDEVVADFALCAAQCKRGGIDGVEIHGAHGYLPHEFLTPVYNKREDEYGGSLENRMRFLVEMLRACREAVGPGYPIGVRLSGEDRAPGGLSPEDVAAIAGKLDADGLVDFVDFSLGTYFDMPATIGPMYQPHGYMLPTSRAAAAAVEVPTIVTGRFTALAEAEALVAGGAADMVSMVRATLADPDIVNRSLAGEAERVRPCIACNQGCIGFVAQALPISCTVNPDAGLEFERGERAEPDDKLNVYVVGGGPAGMEAARTAAEAGHAVTLYEAEEECGGQARLASRATLRDEIGSVLDWLSAEVERVGVEVHTGTRVSAEELVEAAPDAVLVATGSVRVADGVQRLRPDLVPPGIEQPHVVSSTELLADLDRHQVASAVVYDDRGDAEAPAVAETLLERGVAVTFATPANSLGEKIVTTLQAGPFMERMTRSGRFEFRPRRVLTAIGADTVELGSIDTGEAEEAPAELVVWVGRPQAQRGLHAELRAAGVDSRLVGDALEATDLLHAIHTGRAVAAGL